MKRYFTYLVLLWLTSCSDSVSENPSSHTTQTTFIEVSGNTVHGHQTENVYDISGRNIPKIKMDGYNNEHTYQLKLNGVYLKHSYTLQFLSELTHDTIHTDTIYTTLSVDTQGVNLKSDYYTLSLVESGTTVNIKPRSAYNEKEIRIVDTEGSDFYTTIQFETDRWQPKDTITTADFRMRPTPNLVNTAGRLYIYNSNIQLVDSLSSSGANGQRRGDVTYWYSLKFRYANGIENLTIPNGEYIARYERKSDGLVSPFRRFILLK